MYVLILDPLAYSDPESGPLQELVYEVKRSPGFIDLLDVKNNMNFVRRFNSSVPGQNRKRRLIYADHVTFIRK